ncbi:phage tail sheath family protein [Tenacibaculum sp. 190524A02b]|uniref:phage tail sheath family protein n=1 Tax=Tenacibaculum vairaonense TaxID=3137860 RepID=UPI0031FB32EE
MSAYKTPGVYVEEIVKFPPSVAQVETAIPAFIGYTQKATNKTKGDLEGIPTRITSMLEYETYFGFAKKETTIGVSIEDVTNANGDKDRTIVVTEPQTREPFLMYYSLQMYFANGGGPCYITSVGRYGDEAGGQKVTAITDETDFTAGLAAVRKVDEVTLLVFPDATALTNDDAFYGLFKDALIQCNELQDRFTIIDTRTYDADSVTDTNIGILRDKINLEKDYLKYGAAYYPFLKTILNYAYDASSITIAHSSDNSSSLATEITTVSDAVTTLNDYLADAATLATALNDSDAIINDGAATLATIDPEIPNQNVITGDLMTLFGNIETTGVSITAAAATASTAAADDEDPDVISVAVTNASDALDTAITDGASDLQTMKTALQQAIDDLAAAANKADKQTASADAKAAIANISTTIQAIIDLVPAVQSAMNDAQTLDNDGVYDGLTLNELASKNNSVYNVILAEIANLPLELPPSSTMAGVYARVDTDRGVWKAPANVGVNYVIKPTVQVSHEDQRNLNVDTIAGKSINAIRTFIGKGTLVWGARTLAGNDNEWRYVSVRRFFNMAEESIKKATEQFVFEPNDKNTWVRIKAMIDNFLTLQWRAGALAGPTPDKAFYVSVGLGETMTAQDILEGNMIIEIGMAVVRPAEFIILKFSHKMQEA